MQRGCLDEGVFAALGELAGGESECVHMVPGRCLWKIIFTVRLTRERIDFVAHMCNSIYNVVV